MGEEKWLVKSSGRVLGPISLEDIIQGLRTKNLALIDEVKDPLSRWGFIREHPLLREVVRSLRAAEAGESELTQSVLFNSKTSTQTIPGLDDNNTVTNETLPPYEGTRAIEVKERRVNSSAFSTQTFGASHDPAMARKVEQTRLVYKALVTVVILGGALAAFAFFLLRMEEKKSSREQLSRFYQQAERAAEMGQYREAADLLVRMGEAPLSPQQQLFRSQVRLKVGLAATEVFTMSEVPNRRDWELTKALVQMREAKWEDALQTLNALLTVAPSDQVVLVNLALAHFFQKDYQQTQGLLERLPKNLDLDGIKDLLWFNLGLVLNRPDFFAEQDSFEFFVHKRVLKAAFFQRNNDLIKAEQVLLEPWLSDPFDSTNFYVPLLVDQSLVSWEQIKGPCNDLVAQMRDQPLVRAYAVLCSSAQGDSLAAINRLNQARKQWSDNLPLLSLDAALKFRFGRVREAKTFATLAPSDPVALQVLGTICASENDWDCADQSWSNLQKLAPRSPAAAAGRAIVLKKRGNEFGFREQVKKGSQFSPRYRPLRSMARDSLHD